MSSHIVLDMPLRLRITSMTSSPDGNAECAFVQVRAIEEDTAVGSDPVEDISTKERVATALVDTVGARLNAVFKRRKEPIPRCCTSLTRLTGRGTCLKCREHVLWHPVFAGARGTQSGVAYRSQMEMLLSLSRRRCWRRMCLTSVWFAWMGPSVKFYRPQCAGPRELAFAASHPLAAALDLLSTR